MCPNGGLAITCGSCRVTRDGKNRTCVVEVRARTQFPISANQDLRGYFGVADNTRGNFLEPAVVGVIAIFRQLAKGTGIVLIRPFLPVLPKEHEGDVVRYQ